MAGNKNSGGFRPTAPQNNPSNISATGGAGGSGQPSRYISGMPYGQGQELMNQQKGAPMVNIPQAPAAPDMTSAPVGAPTQAPSSNAPVSPLDSPPLTPGKHITDGVDFGRGAGSETLPANLNSDTRGIENVDLIKRYLPDLQNATRLVNAPDSYKRFVNYLASQVQ